jgi:uncharacterized protein (DUF4415 family)
MSKTEEPGSDTYGVPDAENPEWTKEMFARSMRFKDLPASLQAKLSTIQEASRKRRGRQRVRPTKQPVTMRLSPDVLAVLRGKGRGWQTLVDDTLREHFIDGPAKRL